MFPSRDSSLCSPHHASHLFLTASRAMVSSSFIASRTTLTLKAELALP